MFENEEVEGTVFKYKIAWASWMDSLQENN
jgi:hypothetical protein